MVEGVRKLHLSRYSGFLQPPYRYTHTHIYILLCWVHLTIRISCSIFKALEVFAGSQVSLVCRRFENLCAKLLLNAAGNEKSENAPALRVCVCVRAFFVSVYTWVCRDVRAWLPWISTDRGCSSDRCLPFCGVVDTRGQAEERRQGSWERGGRGLVVVVGEGRGV